jgi:ribonuclease HII
MAASDGARFRIGADENGLGPRLGPMVVTAVLARITGDGWAVAGKKPRGKLAERLGDSKQLVSHGDVGLGEAWARGGGRPGWWARALARRGCGRAPFEGGSPDDLLHALSPDDRGELRSPCPRHVEAQCWSAEGESFVAGEDLVRTLDKDLDRLAEKGVQVIAVRSAILCAKRMNEALDAGKNRFVLDLHTMERLVLELRGVAGRDVTAVCGKVGGFGKYSAAFGPLSGRLHAVIEEGRARSAYHFPGVGEISFVRDSDASDLCVAMASLVGKWVREALMARVVRFYQRDLPELPDASGYHDPVTTGFIDATQLVREKRRVPDRCFERRGAEAAAGGP